MLKKSFNPACIEVPLYKKWEDSGVFQPLEKVSEKNEEQESYSVVIPPPNVTGSLHIGHALNYTLQDILIRFERMRGKKTVWVPGFDHAGIATQMVVERNLRQEGKGRRDLGRKAFLEKVWEWKEVSQSRIETQLKRLGVSCDWSRSHFTLDDRLSKAVSRVFVSLSRKKLLYRDWRLVNWDPHFQSAISDLEVENKSVKGKMWHIAYPVEGKENTEIVIATTRPETMLGDTAVAVSPEDKRYQHLIGCFVILPITNRKIPIISDIYVDPEYGTGAVKITPAHDFNDFQVGKRHKLEVINIFDKKACINEKAPDEYIGLDRYEARKRVIEEIDQQGLLRHIETIHHTQPYGDRSGVVIEPYLTYQWFVDAKVLAKPAIEAVEKKKVKFVPEHWNKTYFEWMRNIEPWCISRQLWWGHQIPAWYGPDGEIFVEETEEEALRAAERHYRKPVELKRDPDVLDTWFSSALWPFATLGWPEETEDLKNFFPTSVLVTAFDIIFFWVARMIMQTLEFTGEVPFHHVYIHALVRDDKGQKMSKSKGNVIDPLSLIDTYGADALRFTLAALAAQGRDIKLSEARVTGYRNFGTKLWNAARFCQMNQCLPDKNFQQDKSRESLNLWIISRLGDTISIVTNRLETFRFNEAANEIYSFVWGTYCDWYLELIKPILLGESQEAQSETRAVAAWILDQSLKLLHPFMPYITEEIWDKTETSDYKRTSMLISQGWPKPIENKSCYKKAKAQIDEVIDLISQIRSVRTEMNIPPASYIPLCQIKTENEDIQDLKENWEIIKRLARLSEYRTEEISPKNSAQIIVNKFVYALPLEGIIDLNKERERVKKEISNCDHEIHKVEKKLSNEQFLLKAPKEIIEEQYKRKENYQYQKGRLQRALEWIQ